jgi:hypothetical protein
MSGLLDVLALTGGLLGSPDVPINGPQGGVAVPYGYLGNAAAIEHREPSANIEDRRYMTSTYNPLMWAADRVGPQGYYMSQEGKQRAAETMQKHKAAQERFNRMLDHLAKDYQEKKDDQNAPR